MASGIYNNFKEELQLGVFNLDTDTIKVALLNNSHTFDADGDAAWADVSANEISEATGYTAGGATLANTSVAQDNTNDKGVFDADDVVWSASTITAYHAVIYDTTASNKLIASIDFGGAITSTSGNFTITWNADGILTIS